MENQPIAAGRQWFRLASIARMEQKQPPQPAQPPRGAPIRRASLALGRAPLLPTTTTPPLQTEPTQNPPPAIPQITKQLPPASPAPPPTLNAQPSPKMAPKPSPPVQPQVPLAQELQQTAQTATNGSKQSYVDVPKSPESSSPSQSIPRLRPIITTRAQTPESPTVMKTSLSIPRRSPMNGWPTGSPMHNPEPEPKSPRVATLTKSNHFNESSNGNGMKFNSNGEGVIHNSSESKFITPQAEARKLHPSSYNKEERHQTSSNGKDSIAKGSNSKIDEKDMSMITLAGNNLGAAMEVGSSLHHHQHKDQQSESGKDNKATGKMADAARYSKPMFSLTNSNVQCVDNSVLYNASSMQRSPGVHVTFNRHRQPKNTSSSVQGGHPPLQ